MNQIISQVGSTLAGTDENFLKSIPKMIGGLSSGDKKLLVGAGTVAVGGEVASRVQGEESTGGQITGFGSKIAGLGAVSFVGKDILGDVLGHSPVYAKHRGEQIAKGVTRAIKASSGRGAGRGSSMMNLAERVARGSANLM
jgi:hypothetical protein